MAHLLGFMNLSPVFHLVIDYPTQFFAKHRIVSFRLPPSVLGLFIPESWIRQNSPSTRFKVSPPFHIWQDIEGWYTPFHCLPEFCCLLKRATANSAFAGPHPPRGPIQGPRPQHRLLRGAREPTSEPLTSPSYRNLISRRLLGIDLKIDRKNKLLIMFSEYQITCRTIKFKFIPYKILLLYAFFSMCLSSGKQISSKSYHVYFPCFFIDMNVFTFFAVSFHPVVFAWTFSPLLKQIRSIRPWSISLFFWQYSGSYPISYHLAYPISFDLR